MIQSDDFPRLTPRNHRVTSPPDLEYNCIAWASADTTRWWQPGVYWPVPTEPNEYGLGVLEQLFLSQGYADSSMDASLQPGFEKVALYGSGLLYTHAARQLPTGKWTSKLGGAADIEHDTPDDVGGGPYGDVVEILKRPIPGGP